MSTTTSISLKTHSLNIQYNGQVSLKYLNHVFSYISCRINGTLPSNVEIRDNILTFKGPLTYDVQGTYVCDATNSIGTRSASVEVSILGRFS